MTDTQANPGAMDLSHPGWSLQMMLDQSYARDPRPFFEALRARGPVRDEIEVPGRKPSVLVTRYDEVQATLRNAKVFSSRFGEGMGGLGNDRPMIPLQIDPPEHKKYRKLLDPYLEPRKVARLEAEVVGLVTELIDKFESRGSCELLEEFAVPLPCTVFLRLLGLPLDDLDLFLRIKEGIIRGDNERTLQAQFEARSAAGKLCYEYFEEALDRIQRDRVEGLLLDLLEADIDGDRLTRDEIIDICYLFIIAGLDTVTDSLCCFFTFLADHPEHRRQIVDNPDLIPAAVEELLRWESPVSGVARIATEDTEIGGCPVHKGENLFVLVGAANTDPDGIQDASTVDFHRESNRHFAFGSGIHRCLGSHLARLELRIALREWHRRIPDYHVPPGTELIWTPMLRAVVELPLVFQPSA
ncbi:MAG TPA: cytochrome P450 [Acidimicrobiales bacterium]|nr:cytochrome P450 [Acidimicrobiales bacterium]